MIHRFERKERIPLVLVANMRFVNAVDAHQGKEEEKVAAAKQLHPPPPELSPDTGVPGCFYEQYFLREQEKEKRKKKGDFSMDNIAVAALLAAAMRGGGSWGVLSKILSFV